MNNTANLIVYDKEMNKLAYLENAYGVGYEMPYNGLWSANFTLPATDEKNNECKPLNFIELYDNGEYIGIFRILTSQTNRSSDGTASITYQCEHVLATLLDDILFQYHTVGGSEIPTGDVITYLLNKQSVTRWQLGTCAYNYEFEYTWENDNLLGALFSVPKPFLDEYMWTWNTQVYPWQLNLVQAPTGVESYIRYGVNLQGVKKQVDPSELCTRLYCLGYGEGVNQLTISDINEGKPYIDSDTIEQYGLAIKTFVDRSIENAETLKARAQAVLEQSKHPRIAYSVDASELFALTKDSIDKFKTGSQVRVIDDELGIDIISRVVNYSKGDMFGNPSAVKLEIANKTQDIASSNADMQSRLKINETHAQGATSIVSHDFADNCDASHPAKLRFWVADEAIRINKVLLSFRSEPFRAYSQAIEGGGEYIATVTSAAGGSDIVTSGDSGIDVIEGWGWTEEADGHSHLFKEVRGHKHNIALPNHAHSVDIHIPEHVHPIRYGIYEGPTATNVTVKVDGNTVPGTSIREDSLDIMNYLSADAEGRIERGKWHEIEIAPNTLSRIECAVTIQQFIQSRGGANA